ncbi:MAG: hypothetical protein IPL61_05630 [Myxococcales bacterium]|nr:hypothetical protein [Myxococcales bacterium]
MVIGSRARRIRIALGALALAGVAGLGCAGRLRNPAPARSGATAIVDALAGDDPAAAYALLSKDARTRVSFEEFRLQWQASAAERAWQVARLREALLADPDAGERATITFADGKAVALVRDQRRWRLDAALVSRTRAARPREAVRMFAEAIRAHDLNAFLRSLTRRRRQGLMRQLDGFLAGLERTVEGTIEEIGTDRAELRWDEGGMRYRIVLRKEGDEWLIDDLHIQLAPKDAPSSDDDDDQPVRGIFD